MAPLSPRVFPAWRCIWDADADARELGERVDELIANTPIVPRAQVSDRDDTLCKANALQNCLLLDSQGLGPEKHYNVAKLAIAGVGPAVAAIRWTRWALLEDSLEAASAAGDILFGALILRTMIEELAVHAKLHAYEAATELRRPASEQDLNRILNHARLLLANFLPGGCAFERPTPSGLLKNARGPLNDYVHPNFGNNYLSLWPERSQAGRQILRGIEVIFTQLAQLIPQGRPRGRLEATICPTEQHELIDFQEKSLPRFKALLGADSVDDLRRTIRAEEEGEPSVATALEALDEVDLKPLAELCQALLLAKGPVDAEKILRLPENHPGLGLPGRLSYWLGLGGLRRAAADLEDHASSLSPQLGLPVESTAVGTWVDFISRCQRFACSLAISKIERFRQGAIRALNREDLLGTLHAVRAMIEHFAFGSWVAGRLSKHWASFQNAAQEGVLAVERMHAIEADLSSFLGASVDPRGGVRTHEAQTAWRERWERAGEAKSIIRLNDLVAESLAGNPLADLYNMLSSNVHGEGLSNWQLQDPLLQDERDRQFCVALLVLAGFHEKTVFLGLAGQVLDTQLSLENALGGEIANAVAAAAASAIPPDLAQGRDVLGSGTAEDPFHFRPGLPYVLAMHRQLAELETDQLLIVLWPYEGHLGHRVVRAGAPDLHFYDPATSYSEAFRFTKSSGE